MPLLLKTKSTKRICNISLWKRMMPWDSSWGWTNTSRIYKHPLLIRSQRSSRPSLSNPLSSTFSQRSTRRSSHIKTSVIWVLKEKKSLKQGRSWGNRNTNWKVHSLNLWHILKRCQSLNNKERSSRNKRSLIHNKETHMKHSQLKIWRNFWMLPFQKRKKLLREGNSLAKGDVL